MGKPTGFLEHGRELATEARPELFVSRTTKSLF